MIEGLIGIFVAALAALTFVPTFGAANRTVKEMQYVETATQTCREKVEHIRREGFQLLPTVPDGQSTATSSTETVPNLPSGSMTVQVTRVDSSFAASTTETGRRKVDVTVNWNPYPKTRTMKITTLVVDVAR